MSLEYSAKAKSIEIGNYTHYKGGKYQVLHIARLNETDELEEVVVYQDRENKDLTWVQSVGRFLETVDGKPRFAKD